MLTILGDPVRLLYNEYFNRHFKGWDNWSPAMLEEYKGYRDLAIAHTAVDLLTDQVTADRVLDGTNKMVKVVTKMHSSRPGGPSKCLE